MMYPLVRELAEDGIPVVVTCRVLGFTPQAFYKWRANPISQREWSDAHLVDAARDVHLEVRCPRNRGGSTTTLDYFSPFKAWTFFGEYSRLQGLFPYLIVVAFGVLIGDAFKGHLRMLAWAVHRWHHD